MKPVILIGSGSSVKEGISLDLWNKIRDIEKWSINYAFMTMPYLPTKEVWCDKCFFNENMSKLQELSRQGVQCITKCNGMYDSIPEIQQYGWTREQYWGRLDKPLYVGRMGLSGMLALSLAVVQRYDPIYLLGYDFGTTSMKDSLTHYYQNQITTTSHGVNNPSIYLTDTGVKNEVQDFEVYKSYPGKILNVSLKSNITSFEKISYETFFNLIDKS